MQNAKPVVDGYWEYVDQHNGNMNPNRMAFTQIICLSETDAKAEEEYSEAVAYFYRNTNRVSSGFAQAPGYRSRKSMEWEQSMAEKRGNGRLAAIKGEMGWKEYVEGGYIIAGSPATVRERLREVVTTLRVGQLIPTLHMGNLSEEQANKNTYLMATEVIPYLKDIWSDWEDRWTPQGLKAIQRESQAVATPAG
jgi:alkanesulfonate monooxygenase SsuD/methylene tetrahydromethanopterin reductase-like flavin-dependent oxidoreductase (luciferase family)